MSDTSNKFFLGMQGEDFLFMRPLPQRLSAEDALLLAAWIVAMNGHKERFEAIYQEVMQS